MNDPKKVDPLQIYVQANSFQSALHFLSSNEDPNHMAAVAFPAVVLAAFASELFLKCIICIEGKPVPHWHDLKSLYDLTSKPAQTRMKTYWGLMLHHRADFIARNEQSMNEVIPRDLERCLELGSRSFEELRYCYEPRATQSQFLLSDFPVVARSAILEVKPEWRGVQRNISPLATSPVHSSPK